MKLRKLLWIIVIIFAITIGLYPMAYLLFDMSHGLLALKSQEVLTDPIWNFKFYLHIYLGGIALLIGWTQFVTKLRNRKIQLHRKIGTVYVLSAVLSGGAGLYLAFYASGGIVSKLGFGGMASVWLITTVMAYISIKNKAIESHQKWMIRSYALTFAAVTLRLWMPILPAVFELNFLESYRIIAWLCWVPNLLVAELIINNISRTNSKLQIPYSK